MGLKLMTELTVVLCRKEAAGSLGSLQRIYSGGVAQLQRQALRRSSELGLGFSRNVAGEKNIYVFSEEKNNLYKLCSVVLIPQR